MKALNLLIAGCLAMSFMTIQAQNLKKANIWYFGYGAGLDFSNGNPTSLTNSAMQANEGCISMADETGNLLFYSNGGQRPTTGGIWNRNHQMMLNGSLGLSDRGCGSALQSAIALTLGQRNIHYMFTTDCRENNLAAGLSYHIIDMNLDGGLGGVAQKNIALLDYTTESLAAAKHNNGKDYWIIVAKPNTDSIFAYHLSAFGIQGVTKSNTGITATHDAGEIKISANGQKMFFASGIHSFLMDFNSATGTVSNAKNLNLSFGYTGSFSPDCKMLYALDFSAKKIYQYDVTAQNIAASKIEVGNSAGFLGSMQIGPDNKLYIARRNANFLAVIRNPDIKGLGCEFIHDGVNIGTAQSKFGLPNFPNDIVGECAPYREENTSDYSYALHPMYINVSAVGLSWNPFEGAQSLTLGRRSNPDEEWNTFSVTGNEYTFDNLNPDTDYEFRILSVEYENAIYEAIEGHTYQFDGGVETENKIAKVKTLNDYSFNVFPNPAKHKTSVDINVGDKIADVDVKIIDAGGRIVYRNEFNGVSGYKTFDISLSGLPTGVYFMTLSSDVVNGNKRLVVLN